MGLLRSDPVNANLPPYARALLQAIAGQESGGRYNVRYTPGGGAEFDDLSQHPAIYEPTKDGRKSSAAGRYQFTKSTWDDLGGGSFDPAHQDEMGWKLAQRDYKQRTGSDLATDLQQKGYTPDIQRALAPTWAALGSGFDAKAANYKDALSRYGAGGGGTDPSGVMQTNTDGTLGLKANAPIGLLGMTSPMATGNGSAQAGLANPTMPGAATPVGLLGSNAPMQMPADALPTGAMASANLTPQAPALAAGLLDAEKLKTLGGLGSSLISQAQPKTNQGIQNLWSMAMSDGAQIHRGGFR